MADQEFLASFGVDIDESGVSRLQKILTENKTLGDSLAASFNAAAEGVKAFKESISTDLPSLFGGYGNVTENLFGSAGGLKIGLNMTEPKKEIPGRFSPLISLLMGRLFTHKSKSGTCLHRISGLYRSGITLRERCW